MTTPLKISSLLFFLLIFIGSCKQDIIVTPVSPVTETINSDIAVKWGDMAVYLAGHTFGNSPTYASRGFGYMGLTMYESVVNSSTTYQSLGGQLNGLSTLPKPESGKTYNWILVLNAGQAFMLKKIYEQTTDQNKNTVDSLEKSIYTANNSAQDVTDRSVTFGQAIAGFIFEWSKLDSGYQGYNRNFDPSFQFPSGPGYWKPPLKGQSTSRFPLHPYWGKNRTFSVANAALPVPQIIPYSNDSKSQYYAQFLEVYAKSFTLTQEEKEIANWWGDDPAVTFTPPGHSYNIATIVIKSAKPDLVKAAATYAQVGMATADAFICCWKCKFTYNAERPSSFVNANIDNTWVQFWPEPPFPSFMSGHATQGSAAGTVLTNLYGENFSFVDNSHEGRARDTLRNVDFKNRTFNSFEEAAQESAYSRFLGGIHTRQDNDMGLAAGRRIGLNIASLKWTK